MYKVGTGTIQWRTETSNDGVRIQQGRGIGAGACKEYTTAGQAYFKCLSQGTPCRVPQRQAQRNINCIPERGYGILPDLVREGSRVLT